MCKCKCKCKSNDGQKMICIEEHKYLFAKEMYQHYKELFESALNEFKFRSLNVQHLLVLLEEVVVLLWNNRKKSMIAKVIENWLERYKIDLNIHNSEICDWQYNFSDVIGDENLEYENDNLETEDHQENMEDFNDYDEEDDD